MKKMTARQFQKQFGATADSLKPRQTLAVTKDGQALGTFIKAGRPKVKRPNFLANLRKLGHGKKNGQAVIDLILTDVVTS
jgi:hypothetical protein